MDAWVQIILTGIISVMASSGFWAYMQRRDSTRKATDRMLLGLAYDKIITMGFTYISRGWITQDEYEDYRRYLYEPYKQMGGNGVTERVMAEVAGLPLRPRAQYTEVINEVKTSRRNDDTGYGSGILTQ